MASGPLPKRVVCPACGAPEGLPCVDRSAPDLDRRTFKRVSTHKEREAAALAWYDRESPDGLTPRRRDEMVEALRAKGLGRRVIGEVMARVGRGGEEEFRRALGLTG